MSRNEPEIETKPDSPLQLGRLLFDVSTGELRDSDNQIVDLRKQSCEVLSALARRPVETVPKEALMAEIWPDVAVTDDSLVQCIGDIRRTLGPEARNCIQTVHRRGYRLVPTEPPAEVTRYTFEGLKPLKITRLEAILMAGALLTFGLVGYALIPTVPDPLQAPPDRPIIAVLPFSNTTADPEQQYFIDGLTEDLTTDLSRISGLRMISSASSFAVRDTNATPEEIARNLGATFVVTGNVRRDNRRIRVNAILTEVESGENVWADRFDRDIGGIFDLQDDISRAITSALAVELTSGETTRFARTQRINSDAYDLLLRGLAPLRTFTNEGIEDARNYFRRAIAIDPDYARAHANLALTYGTSIIFRLGDDPSLLSIALKEAETAVEIDPALPQAQFALAVVRLAGRNYDGAIKAAREAIRLDPSYADGYAVLAQTLAYGGDKEEALSAIRTAKLLSPRFTFAYHWVEGHVLFQLRRYEEAKVVLEDVVRRNPAFLLGNLILAATLGHLGDSDEADWIVDEILILSPDMSAFEEGDASPYRTDHDRAHYVEGLLLAGVPE